MSDTDAAAAMPQEPGNRYHALDALRGFALLGIFVINIIGFGIGISDLANPMAAGGSDPLNLGIWYFTALFVEGSMRGLFSLMFGASIILFTARAIYPDGPVRLADLHYRRSIWLIIFGLIHGFVLLMPGDILFLYGVTALFLFPLRILSPKKLLITAGIIWVFLTIWDARSEMREQALGMQAVAIEQLERQGNSISTEKQELLKQWQEKIEGNWPTDKARSAEIRARTGDISTLYATNAEATAWPSLLFLFHEMLDVGMLMLIGMALMKSGWLTGEKTILSYSLMAAGGYIVGLSLRTWLLIERIDANYSPIVTWPWVFAQTSRVALTLGHAGLFLLIWKMMRDDWIMRALAATGRMAFSNYIGQTIISNLIFTGIGLGLYGSLERVTVYLFLAVIFIFQLVLSLWWLARYRFGPLEWLWRSLTYGEIQTMRPVPRGTATDKSSHTSPPDQP